MEQTEGLSLKSLAVAAPEWEGHERAEAVMRGSGVGIDHVAGDRAFYRPADDLIVLPERSQFASQLAYTHTALHALGHATGHPSRLNRATLNNHDGFGSEAYARHESRHGTAYVSSWIKALENEPREIRAAVVDAQKMSDWLLARERDRAIEEEQPRDGPDAAKTMRTLGRDVALDRSDGAPVVPDARDGMMGQAEESQRHVASQRLIVGNAQHAPSAPGDGARDDWARFQDTGPSR